MVQSGVQITIHLSEDELEILERRSEQTGQTLSQVIREMIQAEGQPSSLQELETVLTRSIQSATPGPQTLSPLPEQDHSLPSEFHYQAFLNVIPDLVLRVKRDGTCLECISPRAPQSGVFLPVVNHLREVLSPDLLEEFLQQLEQALTQRSIQVYEHPLEKYGQLYYEEVRMFPIAQDEGLILIRDITAQKQAEQERDRLFSLSLDMICVANFDGYLQQINPSWERVLGFTRDELMTVPYLEFVHPDDREATVAQARALTEGQNAVLFQNRYRCKDGSYRWLSWNAIALPDEKLIYAVTRDITPLKEFEIALRQSEQRYRSLVSNLPGAVYSCRHDPDWTMEFISEAIQDLCGYPASDFLHNRVRTFASIIHPDDFNKVIKAVGLALTKHIPFELEYRLRHQDGSHRWVYERGLGILNADGEVNRIEGVIFDITDRKQMDEALHLAEANYRSIFENALDGIFQSTPEGRYLRVNQAMAQIHGFESPEQMIHAIQEIGLQIYVDPLCRQEFQRLMELQGEVKGLQYQVYHTDGRKVWLEENTRAVRDSDGGVIYYEGIVQDISARKAEEEALRSQLQLLQIEIDQQLCQQEVNKITQTDFFQALQAEVEQLRKNVETN